MRASRLPLPGVSVKHHDDGSRNSMHDLDPVRDGIVFEACAVNAATDSKALETWKTAHGGQRWTEPGLEGGWMLTHADVQDQAAQT